MAGKSQNEGEKECSSFAPLDFSIGRKKNRGIVITIAIINQAKYAFDSKKKKLPARSAVLIMVRRV